MTDKEPEALSIAKKLEYADNNFYAESSLWFDEKLCDYVCDAIEELRRLHEINAELVEALEELVYALSTPETGETTRQLAFKYAKEALAKARREQ